MDLLTDDQKKALADGQKKVKEATGRERHASNARS